MDIPRPEQARQRKRRRTLTWLAGTGLLVLASVGLNRLKPAPPLVEKSSIWLGTVQRGQMLREVRGNGTLVPEEIRWLPALTAGLVERILVLPGQPVAADTVLVELSNPELEQAAFDAEAQLKAAEAERTNSRVQLDSQKLTQQASLASMQASYENAKLDLEVNESLAQSGLVPAITLKQSRSKAEELAHLLEIEHERLRISSEAAHAQLAVQDTRLAQCRALLELKRRQVDALKVRAGMPGVLERLGGPANPLQVGQQLGPGSLVARVTNPARLKAEIKIAESQARDIQLEQLALIDTRNGVIHGHVSRIDPAVENGTVTVDIALDQPMPKGARPDLSVDGTIELERLENIMYVGRPVQGQPDCQLGLFRLQPGGRTAVRVPVKLGRTSVSTIEVLHGLDVGDQIILSDMSQWDAHNRVRLN